MLDILKKALNVFASFEHFLRELQRGRSFFASLPKHRAPSNGAFNIRNEELYLLRSLHSFIANLFVRPLFFFAECARTYLEFSFFIAPRTCSLFLFSLSLSPFFLIYPSSHFASVPIPLETSASTIIKLILIKRTDDR